MSDFEITLPDGRVVSVNAPDRAGAMQAANNFLMREKGAERAKGGYVDNIMRQVGQGASFGLGDEIAAAGDATFGPPVDWALGKLGWGKTNTSTADTWGDRYNQNLTTEQSQNRAFHDTNPVASTTANVVGGIGGAVATLPRAIMGPAATTTGNLFKSGAVGAGMGGVTGFNEGEGGIDERLNSAIKGAAIGAPLGVAAVPVGAALGAGARAFAESKAGRYAADNIVSPAMKWAADVLDRTGIKAAPRSLSAAAPEGGQVPVSGFATDLADQLRMHAPSSDDILTNAAAQRIADQLRRGGTDVQIAKIGDTTYTIPGVAQAMEELGPGAMVADVNPMTQRLASTAYISPGSAPKIINKAMDARAADAPDRVVADVRRAMGDSDPAVIEAARLKAQRTNQGATDFAEAVGPDAPYTISPAMRQIQQEAPAIRKAMDAIEQNAAERGVKLTPAQIAHRVKQQLAADADAAFASGRAINKDDVRTLADRWRSALHEANPEIKAADAAWEANSAKMDALDLGRQFMKQGIGETADAVSPAVLAERIPKMSAEEAQAFIAGASDTLITKANSGPRQARSAMNDIADNRNLRRKLEAMIGEDNTRILYNRAMSERAFAGTDRVVRGGSDTGRKLLSALDEAASGEVPTSAHSMLNRLLSSAANAYNKQKAGNEDVRARIASMLTETDAAANADILDRIARQLEMARRPRMSRGVSTGGAVAGSTE